MKDRCGLALAVNLGDVDHVSVTVEGQVHRGEWMVVTKVQPVELRPLPWDGTRFTGDFLVGYRENSARSERRNSLDPRFTLMWRVACDNRFALCRGVVLGILDRHPRDDAAHFSPH